MYISEKVVLQLREMLGAIPTKYGAAPYAIISQVIVDNANAKKDQEEKKDGDDITRVAE